ncbi:hypothetical protein LJC07_08420, partial [Christensenellaceae bacterium OttesenSCG-928-L17]|nr:hypothetical protein [Christensenellaceae bacterium OttesenSCG-928-L17]
MADKLLFDDASKKSSSGGLFDTPTKASSKTKNIFDEPSEKTPSKPIKTEKPSDLFTEASANQKSAKQTADHPKLAPEPKAKSKKPKKTVDPKKRKKIRTIILACIGSVILIGGGVCATIWAIWYNSDEGILASALENLLLSEDTDAIVDGSVKIETPEADADINFVLEMFAHDKDSQFGLSLDAAIPESRWVSGKSQYICGDYKYDTYTEAYDDCGWDYEYDYQPGHYEYDISEINLSAEAITKGDDYYIKTVFSDLADMLNIYDFKELEDYDDQWIHITKDYLEEILEAENNFDTEELQTCVEDITTRYPKAARDIYALALKKEGGIIQITPQTTRDNLTTYDVVLSSELEDYILFLEELYELPVISDTIDCYVDAIAIAIENDAGDMGGFASAAINRQSLDKMYNQLIKQLRKTNKKDFKWVIEEYAPTTTMTVNRSTRQIENFNIT